MAFKINLSHNGKTAKFEIESEYLVGQTIGSKIDGKEISPDLEGYEIEITGTSDKAGFPGLKDVKGPTLRRVLLTYGIGMHKRPRKEGKKPVSSPKGLRLKKSIRGNEISEDTVQINSKVLKEGKKKFEGLFKTAEAPVESSKEDKTKEVKEEKTKHN